MNGPFDDDDLPVLTQILRTGKPRAAAAAAAHAVGPAPVETPVAADQLVIGNQPRIVLEAFHVPSFDGSGVEVHADGHVTIADAATIAHHGPDSFRLPQDHDAVPGSRPAPLVFDEPDIAAPGAPDMPVVDAVVSSAPLPVDRADAVGGDAVAGSLGVDPAAQAVAADPPPSPVGDVTASQVAEDPATLAARIRDEVLEALTARIDTELDARVAQAIHVEVETALGQLQNTLRAHLADALRDVVGRAVHDALARTGMPRS